MCKENIETLVLLKTNKNTPKSSHHKFYMASSFDECMD